MKRTTAIAAILAAGCVLASCSSSSDSDNSTPAPSPSSSSSSTSAAPSQIVQPTNLPSSIANDKTGALRKSVKITSCVATADGWKASGTAVNSRDENYSYALTVYFTTSSATVVGFDQISVTVPPDGTGKWTASAKFPASKGTKCVLVGVANG